MTHLYCPSCASGANLDGELDPEDIEAGFKRRVVQIPRVKKPAVHGVAVNDLETGAEKFHALENLYCDLCNQIISPGSPAVAVTMWRTATPPEDWEKDYTDEGK